MYFQFETESHFDGRVQIAYLNSPQTYNALTKPTLTELREFFSRCSNDENVRCVAISGRGKAFCSGQNLEDAMAQGQAHHERKTIYKIVKDYYNPLVMEVTQCKKPVVALVNGPAVGAGAMLALISDIVLCAENAYFSQAFSQIGLVPDTGGTYFLPKLIGRQMANYLAFTGKKLSAAEAQNYGLAAEVFPTETFMTQSLEVLENIANMPTAALKLTKKAFAQSYDNSLKQQLLLEADLQEEAANTLDFQEGVAAFLQKRKPEYRGK